MRAGHGAHLNARSKRGVTPLIFASGHGHLPAMEQLLKAGADLSAAANNGGQALHAAVAGGHARAVELLLRRGAPVDARDRATHGTLPHRAPSTRCTADLVRHVGHR